MLAVVVVLVNTQIKYLVLVVLVVAVQMVALA
jgi:hypothetical protein